MHRMAIHHDQRVLFPENILQWISAYPHAQQSAHWVCQCPYQKQLSPPSRYRLRVGMQQVAQLAPHSKDRHGKRAHECLYYRDIRKWIRMFVEQCSKQHRTPLDALS